MSKHNKPGYRWLYGIFQNVQRDPAKSCSIFRVNWYVQYVSNLCCLVCIHDIWQLRNDVTHRYVTWKRSMSTGRISYIHPAIKTFISSKKPKSKTTQNIKFRCWPSMCKENMRVHAVSWPEKGRLICRGGLVSYVKKFELPLNYYIKDTWQRTFNVANVLRI